MIHTLYFPTNRSLQWDLAENQLKDALADDKGLLWVSLENPSTGEFQSILADLFHFHPLAIEDCQSTGFQTPKVDDYGEYLFIVVLGLSFDQTKSELVTEEFDLFLGKNYVVTNFNTARMPAVEKLKQRLKRDERLLTNGADSLCHALIDIIVDDYSEPLEILESELEVLEDSVLSKPQAETLEKILHLKHSIMAVRRVVAPQREIINHLSRDEYPLIDLQSRLYFRDIYDHLVRVYDWVDILRDMATNALEVYLNATSLRLNEVMKALTIVSTIFLPLAFVAGVYGMNFHFMPEITWKWGYPMAWVIFLTITIGMLAFFRKRRWF